MTRILLLGFTAMALAEAIDYSAWRSAREASLKAEGGWLSVAGLFWLQEGSNKIDLPDGSPVVFDLHEGKVTSRGRNIAPDSTDVVKTGRFSLFVIKRGDRFGIRLKDPESSNRRNFHGLEYFSVSESWRITARFVPEPRKIPVLNVLGQTEDSECPGYAVFNLKGKEYRLHPILEEAGAKELFFIFRDQTAGKETYPAGRFLYSDLPKDGKVVLDFNKAYNPPCAFTEFATCPLPPRDNHLTLRIEAGEKKYDIH